MKRIARAAPPAHDGQLPAHLLRDRYGDFRLTRAIRPGAESGVIPESGYRLERTAAPLPRLAASVSAEALWEVFLELVALLGEETDVYLQSSHRRIRRDYLRRGIDRPVLLSYLMEFEELLLHDGYSGIIVVDRRSGREVHFDEHKVLIVYAQQWQPFVQVFESFRLPRNDRLRLILEGVHYHCSQPEYALMLERFRHLLGAEEHSHLVWDS